MNNHKKECLEGVEIVKSFIKEEQYYNALSFNTSLQDKLLKALAGEMPVEACKVPKYTEVCSCGMAPYIDETDSEKTRIHCPRCLKEVSAPTKRDAIEDWNNAVYAFKANKLFPKRCSCGSEPRCDTQPAAINVGFIVRCLECRQSRVAASIKQAIEEWNNTTPDYIDPVKEECGNCRFWHRLRNVLRLKEKGAGACRKQSTYLERFDGDWCGDWEAK